MKILFLCDNHIIIYIQNECMKALDYHDANALEQYFRALFLRLHKHYQIELSGYYNIVLYHDPFYGVVIELRREELDYYSYYESEIDMRITVEENRTFLYEIEDIFFLSTDMKENGIVYIYKDRCYYRIVKKLSKKEQAILLEHGILCYENTDEMIKYGKRISCTLKSYGTA